MANTENKTFRDFDAFRRWLKDHYKSASQVYVYIYKKSSEKKGLSYEDAVLAGLCYGWIDSMKRSYDEEKYILKLTPRKKNSNWSLSNIKRMKWLIEHQQMTEYGLNYFDMDLIKQLPSLIEAEKSILESPVTVPVLVQTVLKEDSEGLEGFKKLSNAHKKRYITWITSAKQEKTQKRRTQKMIAMIKANKSVNDL